MQAGMFVAVLITTAYAPLALLQGWLHDDRRVNPVTQVLEAARQGFVGERHLGGNLARRCSPWRGCWLVLGALALREMRRTAQ